jgi:uncharacterized iron-regulated protein
MRVHFPFAALACAVALVLLSACAAVEPTWITTHDRDHPMVGRIIDPATGAEVTSTEAARRIRRARYLFLGEKHDNPDHHKIQAALLQTVTDAGRRPAVTWEMIDEDQGLRLRRFLAANPTDGAAMGAALGWERSGWPDWTIYQPIADAAIAARLPMAPASPRRTILRRPAPAASFALPARLLDGLKDELLQSHCGHLPGTAIGPMATAQQRRDLAMADSLLAHATADGAVLIAGNGHARRDRGAPWWLTRLGVDPASILSVGVMEVDPARRGPEAMTGFAAQFDLIYLTPRVDSDDPCEKFAEQLKRLRK